MPDLPNTQQQTKQGSQNWEAKKHGPNERIGEKERNEMEASEVPGTEFKTM